MRWNTTRVSQMSPKKVRNRVVTRDHIAQSYADMCVSAYEYCLPFACRGYATTAEISQRQQTTMLQIFTHSIRRFPELYITIHNFW
ncbi:hypothetical protein Plhal304r1_c015g0056791 [Plasmopara halstedii]